MDTAHRPLVLTLRLNEDAQTFFNSLRQAHFPKERNFLEAHCTLFHALPGKEKAAIDALLKAACGEQAAFGLQVGAPRFTGRGVAYPLSAAQLNRFHKRLQQQWWNWLSPQDRQGLHPHVTVQNKVKPEAARALQTALAAEFPAADLQAQGTGLQLWEYLGGPWGLLAVYDFGA